MAKSIKIALELDTRDFGKGINRAKGEVKGLNESLGRGTSAGSGFRASMVGVTAALAGVASAAVGLKSSLQVASQVEQLGVTLETLYGDSERAAEGLNIIKEQAAKLSIGLTDIQSGVPSLALVEEKFGGLGNAIQFTSGIANSFGMSFQEAASNVQRALSAGIGAADLFRDKGVKAFLEFEEGAEYTAEQTQLKFLESFQKVVAGNAKAVETLTGQYSMVTDAVDQVQEAFGTAFGESVKTVLKEFNKAFSDNKEEILATAKALGEDLGKALIFIIQNFEKIIPLLSGIAAGFVALKLANTAMMFASLGEKITKAGGAMKYLNTVIKANPIGLIVTAVGLAVTAFMTFAQNVGGVGNALKIMANTGVEAINTVINAFNAAGDAIKAFFVGFAEDFDMSDLLDPEAMRENFANGARASAEAFRTTMAEEGPFTIPFDLEDQFVATQEAAVALGEEAQAAAEAQAGRDQAAIEAQQALQKQIEELREQIQRMEEEKAANDEKDKERKEKEKKRILDLAAAEQQRFDEAYAGSIRKIEQMILEQENQNELIGLTQLEREKIDAVNKVNQIRDELLDKIYARNISEEEKAKLIAATTGKTKELILELLRQMDITDEQQRRFSTGWKNAWADYKDAAENNAKMAGELFNTVTSGMENAFVDFVSTGKLSFKSLIDDMIKQLMRIVAKKIFMKILGFLSGGLGSIFAGFFDKGGTIGAGKFGIVGEKGPEIVTGPARVIGRQETASMLNEAVGGRGQTINYTIHAIDTASFKSLISRDPEFLYNVTVAGARRLPR